MSEIHSEQERAVQGAKPAAKPSQKSLDLELVRRVQRGDKAAFDLLVSKYQHKVINLVARFVKAPGDVADVTQEAFIKAYRALPGFRGESAFYTWLYRIAVNTAKNHLVSAGRRPPSSDVDADEAETYEGGHLLTEVTTPEGMLLAEELRRKVFEAMEALPDDLRSAISLREMEGLSYEEIAVVMDCPVGTVRSRIFRAREAIDRTILPLLQG